MDIIGNDKCNGSSSSSNNNNSNRKKKKVQTPLESSEPLSMVCWYVSWSCVDVLLALWSCFALLLISPRFASSQMSLFAFCSLSFSLSLTHTLSLSARVCVPFSSLFVRPIYSLLDSSCWSFPLFVPNWLLVLDNSVVSKSLLRTSFKHHSSHSPVLSLPLTRIPCRLLSLPKPRLLHHCLHETVDVLGC